MFKIVVHNPGLVTTVHGMGLKGIGVPQGEQYDCDVQKTIVVTQQGECLHKEDSQTLWERG